MAGIIFADPVGVFYATTAQAIQGMYNSVTSATIVTSLPTGAKDPAAFQGNLGIVLNTTGTLGGPYTLGFRCYIPNGITAGQNIAMFTTNINTAQQLTFQTNANGTLTVKRGDGNGTVIATTSTAAVLTANTWNYIELQAFINSSTGYVNVQINNTNVLSLANANTQAQGTAAFPLIQISSPNNTGFLIQDIYVTDSTMGFLGDVSFPVYTPNRAGLYSQYAPSGAATIWQCVDEATPDDLGTFAFDSTVGDRMDVGFNSAALSGTILGVIHVSRVSKSDSGARTFAQTLTSNGVDAISAAQTPATTFAYFSQFIQNDPATGQPWTLNGVNAVTAGIKTVG